MAKDYTDYVSEIHGKGDRVYFQEHYRQLKKDALVSEYDFNGRTYLLNKDRAYRVKGYNPWKKWDWEKPLWSLIELMRTKKVGLIKHREPPTSEPLVREVRHKVPKEFICKICGFTTAHPPSIKTHLKRKHKTTDYGPNTRIGFETTVETVKYYPPVEPMHISKMHQPSGHLALPDGSVEGIDADSLLQIITPRILKVEIEDDTYKKAYKSYKFGNIVPITQKWYIWVMVAVVAVFAVLYLTGNFSFGGR